MTVDRSAFLYTPYYCEENIWHLCQTVAAADKKVVFISNPRRQCFLWHQRACPEENVPICWDYHVVLLGRDEQGWKIWDLDTRLPLPMNACEYLYRTFVHVGKAHPDWDPLFRLVDEKVFVMHFSSDRSHMLDVAGNWTQPPPPWECIGKGKPNNLHDFIDMQGTTFGAVLDLTQFQQWLGDRSA
jgi:protein N-terminal glutamine amidohydrolase